MIIHSKWINEIVEKTLIFENLDVKFKALMEFLQSSKQKVKYMLGPEQATKKDAKTENKTC